MSNVDVHGIETTERKFMIENDRQILSLRKWIWTEVAANSLASIVDGFS